MDEHATLRTPHGQAAPAPAPAAEAPAPGSRFGRYTVVAPLGAGGMGEVFRAFDPSLQRFVALKLLRAGHADAVGRFLLEARAQARIDHPNVCKVHEAGVEGGRPYISMQLVEGPPLGSAARDMSVPERVAVMRQVAEAVHAAHRTGLIHRDLKPANVLVSRDEEGRPHPWVLDFGLAKESLAPGMTVTGAVVGTPSYMAPEQARGEEVDRRTDVYGLGATLFEVLCGVPPVEGTAALDIMSNVASGRIRRPRALVRDLPADLETIALKCLAPEPSRRYESARALADDLARFLDGEPITARPTSLAYRLARKARKNRPLVVVGALGLAAALAGTALAVRARWQAFERERTARRFGQEVKEVETQLRLARMLPVGDIRGARRAARARVGALEAGIGTGASEGPGRYLLGRALFALGDLPRARRELERAAALGFSDPGLELALGRTLGELYRRGREEAERGREKSEARLKEIERTLRDPALTHLHAARPTDEDALLAEALIALYEKRWDEARGTAARALARAPWLWEARAVVADAWLARAGEDLKTGAHEAALADCDKAGTALAAALDVGRSDVSLHLRDAARWNRVMDVEHILGRPVDAAYRQALEACARARRIDPDDPEPDVIEASVTWRRAENGMGRGEDPRPLYERAVALGTRAAERGSPIGWTQVGTAWHGRAMYEAQVGVDPIPSLEKAAASYEGAMRASPASPSLRANAGYAQIVRAEHEMNLGHDPTSFLKRAVALEEDALKLDPAYFQAANSLGWALQKGGEWEKMKGRDPRPLLGRAETALRGAVALNPNFAYGWVNLGNVLESRGEWERLSGIDPVATLESSLACYRKARGLAPEQAVAYVTSGFAAHQKALWELESGASPRESLAEGREALTRAVALNRSFALALLKLGDLETVEARWAMREHRPPEAAFARAEAAYEKARGALAKYPALWTGLADMERWRAEAALAARRRPAAEIARGLAAADKALRFDPGGADGRAARGALLVLSARTEKDAARRAAAARDARTLLEGVLAENALYSRDLSPLLAEARRLERR